MNSKLNVYKNIGWAIGIILCLMALFVALIVGAFTRYGGEKERETVDLSVEPTEKPIYVVGNTGEVTPADTLDALPETADGGQSYIDSLTFLLDSTAIGLRDYGLLSGGQATTQIWGTESGSLPIGSLANATIRYPGDGSEVSPAAAAMIAKPSRLVIIVGADGLAQVDEAAFLEAYSSTVRAIQSASPDTVILLSSIPSVVTGYSGADGLTPAMIGEANEWVRQVSRDTGAYFVDAASVLRDSSGSLMGEYASANGKTLNSAGLNKLLEYLRTHTA